MTFEQTKSKANINVVRNPEFNSIIVKIMETNGVPPNVVQILKSLQCGLQKYGSLTVGQDRMLTRFETEYSEILMSQKINESFEWEKNWNEDKQRLFKIAIAYYTTTGYFQQAVLDARDTNYIPSERLFVKITENKYAAKVIALANTPALFEVGDNIFTYYRNNSYCPRTIGIIGIVLNTEKNFAAKAGGRLYEISPIVIKPLKDATLWNTEQANKLINTKMIVAEMDLKRLSNRYEKILNSNNDQEIVNEL